VRVLLVNAHGADPAFGGAERYVRELGSGLEARGHTVQVLSAFPQQGQPDVETHVLHQTDWRESSIRRLSNHVGGIVSAPWPRLEQALTAIRPDLVHTNNLPGIGTGIWEIARRRRIPLLHTLHDYYLFCPRTSLIRRNGSPCRPHPLLCGTWTRRLTRWQAAVGAVIAVSRHVLRLHQGLFPAATKHVVPPPLRPLSGLPPEPLNTPPTTFGFIGALTPIKGVALLLEAAPALAQQGVRLRVAGDGPLRPDVEAAPDVHYEGRLEGEDLAAFVGSCDLGLVPSLWDEPGPFVVGEWLAAGRPLLATRRGGLAEAERRGGVLTFEECSAALVDAALRVRDPEQWAGLVATLPHVDGDADIERWLDAHELAYEAAIERLNSPA
jgi:glycosyltransferase involved in cell wall biosynthesis